MYKKIPAGKFKSQCLMVMDRVKKYGEPVTITKHGKPVATLVPADDETIEDLQSPSASWLERLKLRAISLNQ